MKNIDLFNAVSGVDESLIERSLNVKEKSNKAVRFRWIAAAACVLLVIIGTVTFAVAAEAKEYSDAIAFFEENGLDAQGLSRDDIKAVYRDITQEHFTYGKTAEVIKKSIGGWEIEQDEPTPEEIAESWIKNLDLSIYLRDNGISYMKDFIYGDQHKAANNPDKSMLKCYRDKELVWTAEFENCWIEGWRRSEGLTAVWGYTTENIPEPDGEFWYTENIYWAACTDDTGKVLWKKDLRHDLQTEIVRAVVQNEDGTWAFFSYGIDKDEKTYICITTFDTKGEEIIYAKAETARQDFPLWHVVRLDNEYLVQAGDIGMHRTASFLRIDAQGNISDNYSYSGENCEYLITDMTEFGGNIYLSAYAYPKAEDEGGRHEIAHLLEYAHEKYENDEDISSEEFTPIVRDNYTAVLLICDTDTGKNETFYEVKGSFGGSLAVTDDGMLEWEVKSITSAEYYPTFNAYSIHGRCRVFGYTFGTDGRLKEKIDTERYETFYR